MQSKGTLGSVIAGVIAIFLVLVCLFYLSFSLVANHHENKAEEYALVQAKGQADTDDYNKAKKHYLDSISQENVWLGYSYNEVQKWGVGLGLDLKGGMSVILQVSVPDMLRAMKNSDKDDNFELALANTDSIVKANKSDDYVGVFVNQYRALMPMADLSQVFDGKVKKGASVGEAISQLKKEVENRVDNTANNVLRNRIDAFGVVSPNIQVLQGKDGQILLELPGVKEPDRVVALLQRAANLEFYATYKENFPQVTQAFNTLEQTLKRDNKESLFDKSVVLSYEVNKYGHATDVVNGVQKGVSFHNPIVGYFNVNDTAAVNNILKSAEAKRLLPSSIALRWAHNPETYNKQNYFALYALNTVNGKPVMDGSHVVDATADYNDKQNTNSVSMVMDSEGAREWSRVTGQNINFPIAIVLDDQVYSAPNVNTKIDGGRSEITGNFDVQEAQDLANVLKSGKMNAKVTILNQMVIGPSLGAQSIQAGFISFIVALVFLMILMVSYYGLIPGLIANFALFCNLFFTFGILASFQAVLTLSGLAGIVLAFGMAVDANVLIYERAKEELRAGKNSRTAIANGYSNAFSAIFDSNLTSIITGVILLFYGTGPIKGFATTLIIGLICSFFTAVFLTRIVFVLGAKKRAFERLTFTTALSRKMFINSNFDFLGKSKVALGIVIAAIAIILGSFCINDVRSGIDFSGGRNYIVKFDQPVSTVEIQEELKDVFPGSTVSVITIDTNDKVRVSTNYKIEDDNTEVDNEIADKLYETLNKYNKVALSTEDFSTTNETVGIMSSQKVGPTVAEDMKNDAYVAVGLSLIAMFLYILLRFHNVAFSFGALAAVAFTAYTIIGLYSLFYGILPFAMEVDQTFIAAILTVIGYQINDTVIVFDRVRENLSLYPKRDLFSLINLSINSTLGRTIMTSGSTFLVLLCIFCLGGDSLRSFIFAMMCGVVIGTLATIFIASPVAYAMGAHQHKGKKNATEAASVATKR